MNAQGPDFEHHVIEGVQLLKRELSLRISKNPRYSLRSFARALEISPAMLSLILAQKQKLSSKIIEKMIRAIQMSPSQVQKLQEEAKASKISKRYRIRPRDVSDVHNVNMAIFEALSHWRHYAILSLLDLPNAKLSATWIASQLGIGKMEAQLAIDSLLNLKMIEKKNGRWKQTSAPLRMSRELSTAAARQFQKELITKAIESLENDPSNSRDITSMTFTMNTKDLEYASERITEFRRSLVAELEARSQPNSVATIAIQLFPLSKEQKS